MSDTIHALIPKIMGEVGVIGKTGRNVQQDYAFRGIDAVMGALQPILVKHGVYFVPEVLARWTEERTTRNGGFMEIVALQMRYTFYAADGSSVSCSVIGEASDTADKASNKAMSAALKYALTQTFCVPTQDMDDADKHTVERGGMADPFESARPAPRTRPGNPATAELMRGIKAAREALGMSSDDVATEFAAANDGLAITAGSVTELSRFLNELQARGATT